MECEISDIGAGQQNAIARCNVHVSAELPRQAGASCHLQDQAVITVGEQLRRSAHAKRRAFAGDNAKPRQHPYGQIAMEWRVRQRLNFEPQDLTPIQLAPDRGALILGSPSVEIRSVGTAPPGSTTEHLPAPLNPKIITPIRSCPSGRSPETKRPMLWWGNIGHAFWAERVVEAAERNGL